MVNGPSGSLSQRGSLRKTPEVASGSTSEKARPPALPRLVSSAMPLRSISVTERPASTSLNAAARPTMPAPMTATSVPRSLCMAASGSGELGEIGTRGQRLVDDVLDHLAFVADQSEARGAHPFGAFAGHLVDQLDVLDELRRNIEMQHGHEPAIERQRLVLAAGLGEPVHLHRFAREAVGQAGDPARGAEE